MIEREELIKKLNSGMTVREIANEKNCGEMSIYRRIKKFNIKKEEPMYKNKKWLENKIKTMDIQDIAMESNVDTHTISRWMKKLDIKKPRPLYQNKEWLIEQSYKFDSILDLCREFNFKESTVVDWCREYSITFNTGRRKNIEDDYFSKIDTERKAYFLGFLMADGYMSKDIQRFGIGLMKSDQYIIQELLNDLRYKTEIKEAISGFGKDSVVATICSKKMCENLVYLGIVPKKSGKEIFPEYAIEQKLKRHFIRGFVDGDGWITNSISQEKYMSLQVGMCSMSINILNSIKEFIESELEIPVHLNKRTNKDNLYDIKIHTNYALKFLDYIYKDSTIYLERKKKKYDNIMLGPIKTK